VADTLDAKPSVIFPVCETRIPETGVIARWKRGPRMTDNRVIMQARSVGLEMSGERRGYFIPSELKMLVPRNPAFNAPQDDAPAYQLSCNPRSYRTLKSIHSRKISRLILAVEPRNEFHQKEITSPSPSAKVRRMLDKEEIMDSSTDGANDQLEMT
jgi:hypothetical protein